jgi:hypothetical protein
MDPTNVNGSSTTGAMNMCVFYQKVVAQTAHAPTAAGLLLLVKQLAKIQVLLVIVLQLPQHQCMALTIVNGLLIFLVSLHASW